METINRDGITPNELQDSSKAALYETAQRAINNHMREIRVALEYAPDDFPARAMLIALLKGFDQLLNADANLDDIARLDRARESIFSVFDLGDASARGKDHAGSAASQ
jgi:hypothetical protein